MSWKEEARELRFTESLSWTETSAIIHTKYFPTDDPLAIHEKVRGYLRHSKEYKKTQKREQVVGIIGDTHFPFVHPNYIHFLEDTFRKHRVTKIIQIGDLCDNHAISRHQTETDAMSATTEYDLALENIEEYVRAFPEVHITLGNHCKIPERQAASLGIPLQFLQSFHELWGLPKKWTVTERIIIDDVLYEHGINATGKTGALNKALSAMQSCVIGHSHAYGGCQYRSNSQKLVFGLNVGCGIDIDDYAFRYGRYSKDRETLGCGIVYNSAHGTFVPMPERYFRKG